ncbi:MAG: hypothetical protein ACI4A5_00425 [Hominilimicola sp.]
MIYSNDDPMALLAMELERTGNYGDCDEYSAKKCPVCGAYEPEYYYLDEDEECIGCSECVYRSDVLF